MDQPPSFAEQKQISGQAKETYLDKPLPNSEESEKLVIGSCILFPDLWDQTLDLQPSDFYSPLYKRIFLAMRSLNEKGVEFNPITIHEEMKLDGNIPPLGGVLVLSNLTNGLPHFTSLKEYVDKIIEKARIRKLIYHLRSITESALSEDKPYKEFIAEAEAKLEAAGPPGLPIEVVEIKNTVDNVIAQAHAMQEHGTGMTGVSTGFDDIDMLLLGLQRQDLIILAGRPSMGKTALGMCMAQNIAFRQEGKVFVASLEMGYEQLTNRVVSSESMVDARRFRTGLLSHDEWARVEEARQNILKGNLFIYDKPSINPFDLKSALKKITKIQGQLDLVVIDYIQLMSWGGRAENRQQEVTKISAALKGIAKEFDVPVLALSQLSRKPEARAANGHRPELQDLRESGSIEQDADVVTFVYREDYYPKADGSKVGEGTAEFIIGKQRNGPTDTVMLSFQKQFTKFSSYDPGF